MEKRYRYRKHLRYIQNSIPWAVTGLLAVIWGGLWILNSIYHIHESMPEVFILAGVISILFAAEGIIILFMLRRFNKIEVRLNNDNIIYKNIKSESVIPITEITRLEFPSIKYTGGWIKIISKSTSIRLTVVIEGIDDFLKNLKEIIDMKGLDGVYNKKAFYSFYKTAAFADQGWDRLYEIFSRGCLFGLINMAVGVIASIYGDFEITGIILIILLSLIGPSITYIISEIIIGRKIAAEASAEDFTVPERDRDFEGRVYKIAAGTYSIVYLILLVVAII